MASRLIIIALMIVAAAALPASASAAKDDARYEIAGGCYSLASSGKTVDGPFHMQATALGQYLFFGAAKDFLAAGTGDAVVRAATPSPAAEWRIDVADRRVVTVTNLGNGRSLGVAGSALTQVDRSQAGRFTFERATGCATWPEAEVNATGEPSKGVSDTAEVRGLIDTHLHAMAFEFLGGRARCGRPWHPYGITFALVDCPDHEPGGRTAVLENALSSGDPTRGHDTVGWPTFKDWPASRSLTHEQVYYKWLERSWRGGLRLFVNLLVDNAVLCEVYPYKKNSCNEMDGVRLQAKRTHQLEDYIDAQSGGPGKGWFRIVTDPFEARKVINDGKLAVVMGIEISKLFDCGEFDDVPDPGCDRASIDRSLDEVHRMGVRQIEFVNKFDNALSGVAGDAGQTGILVNSANKYETNHYWAMETCTGDEHAHDQSQSTVPGIERDPLAGAIVREFLGAGVAPLYAPGPHCNNRGLTALGTHLLHKTAEKQMIFDPDHMSAKARRQALTVMEEIKHPGIISSHSWSTEDAFARILKLGGLITPAEKSAGSWLDVYRKLKALADPRFFFGTGASTDMNGFAGQGGPRTGPNQLTYPFKSFDGKVTLDRNRAGSRVWDFTVDGVAHFGMYPDFVEDVRKVGGAGPVEDMARGAEAYLQMWERTVGVDRDGCQEQRASFDSRGVQGLRVGDSAETALQRGGQPSSRPGSSLRYCVAGDKSATVAAALTPQGRVALVGSTGRGHQAGGVSPGDAASALTGARSAGRGLLVRPARNGRAYVFGIRAGKVRFVALASKSALRSERRLRSYISLAGL